MEKQRILDLCNSHTSDTLMQTLGIVYTDAGADYVVAKMQVTKAVHQPAGLLHGGASAALAESVGSMASHLFIDRETQEVRGIEISANHLRSKKEGEVTAKATLLHKGKTTHLWEIRIVDEKDALISWCKLTNIILPKTKK